MFAFTSRLCFDIVVMSFLLPAIGISSFIDEELSQAQMLRIARHLVQAQKSQFNFWVTRVAGYLALSVSQGGCKQIHVLEDWRQQFVVLVVQMMSQSAFN